MPGENKDLLIETIKERSCLKRNVYENTIKQFNILKSTLNQFAQELDKKVHSFDQRLEIKYEELSNFECRLTMAGDTLVFYMHSNVFQFDPGHHVWNSSYVKENENRAFCGVIHIYNFLADSFRLRRMNDVGYMIGRVFVNHEDHYLVEGKRQLGYLFNDFVNSHLDKTAWKRILESALLYSLDFNLLVPPYNQVNTTSVLEISQIGVTHTLKTGKRFGFQFSVDDDSKMTS
ncbi:MAG: hypothetical protein HKO93_04875 [Flavobacteriales bacterium]|nr:hypothetical protein [Flavobacteriales bacterium]